MKHHYPPELKEKVVKEALQKNVSHTQIARKYHLSAIVLSSWIRQFRNQQKPNNGF
ncbi:transposase (plasmid) [Aneurinibacillus sp. Ricciae_BoGa-3]|uniref:transposase n=1 Tax=Aneurinibacillus sp. Ricciae_BoGa-3 TaxID=3022697 RepID=UPI00234068A8|nr:transposase [Aneurinibacillus sp. Ricciae_BoGa-3]WCK57296.1 transposase [Aneurinibacillus sp. Ricciae_BoGa-3]